MIVIQVKGLVELRRRIRRMPDTVTRAGAEHLQRREAPRLVATMHGLARTRLQRREAGSLHVQATRNGVKLGTGSDILQKGAEFGGRRQPKRAYATRSRNGRPYVVRRRATMQFLPYLGNRGYWFWPAVRQDLRGVRARIHKAIRGAIQRG